jgi:hypothetical protein
MTDPVLLFSATSLATIGFRPGILARTVQTIVRYAPPVVLYRWKQRAPARSRGGAPITIPVPTGAATTARVPAAEK